MAISGCSLDLVSVAFCASEQQRVAIDDGSSFTSFTSSQTAMSLAVGDSVRLVAHGFCRNAGLNIEIATRRMRWRSHDASIVRLSPVTDGSAVGTDIPPAVWAVGVAPGETVVGAELNGAEGVVAVKVR